jgi:hypothetical protein
MKWITGETLCPVEFLTKRQHRGWKFLWQRICSGWDDSVTWDLSSFISKYVLSRLRRFKQLNIGYPPNLTAERWDAKLDKMIEAFELHTTHWEWYSNVPVEERDKRMRKIEQGLKLFAKYYWHLWW